MFEQYKSMEVSARDVADYVFIELRGEPVLQVHPAGEVNKPYINAMLKRSKARARQVKAGGVSAAMLKEQRDEDRDLFAKFVVAGWSVAPLGGSGRVEFSQENCELFLKAIPDDIFDGLREFCLSLSNFRPDEMSPEDVSDLAKN